MLTLALSALMAISLSVDAKESPLQLKKRLSTECQGDSKCILKGMKKALNVQRDNAVAERKRLEEAAKRSHRKSLGGVLSTRPEGDSIKPNQKERSQAKEQIDKYKSRSQSAPPPEGEGVCNRYPAVCFID